MCAQDSAFAHLPALLRALPLPGPGRDLQPRPLELLRAVLACAIEVRQSFPVCLTLLRGAGINAWPQQEAARVHLTCVLLD